MAGANQNALQVTAAPLSKAPRPHLTFPDQNHNSKIFTIHSTGKFSMGNSVRQKPLTYLEGLKLVGRLGTHNNFPSTRFSQSHVLLQ